MATPDNGLAAAAPETAAAPSAAPETSVASTPEATPSTPQVGGQEFGESSASFFSRALQSKQEVAAKPEAAAATETPTETPKEGDVQNDTPVETPKEEVKPEEKPTEEKPVENPEEEDKPSLDEPELVGIRDLAAKLKGDPELDKKLEEAGLKNAIFATARHAAKAGKVLEVFGDLETAQDAKGQAEQFGTLTQMMVNAQSVEDTHKLLGEMWKLSYVLDEEGNPVVDQATGQPKDDGTIGRFLSNVNQIANDFYAKQVEAGSAPPKFAVDMLAAWAAKHGDDPDLAAAMEILQGKYQEQSGSASAPDYSALDAQTRARLEAADAREKEVAAREAADQQRQVQEFELKVGQGIDTKLDTEIESLFQNSALSDGQKKWAVDQVKTRVLDKLKASPMFFNKRDALARRPMSEKTANARIAHGINSARPLLVGIAREVVAELGVQIGAKREAGAAKLATQLAASKSEIRSGAQPAKPQTMSTADLYKMAQEEARKESGGREPSSGAVMAKLAEIKARR
jgi:hypothetical protein